MTIYLDIVFIENLLMNFIILYASGIILKNKLNILRLILSSTIGAIYVVILYIGISKIYSSIITKIILSIVMIYTAFVPDTFKKFIKEFIIFYLTSFIFGGTAFACMYFFRMQDIFSSGVHLNSVYPIKIAFLGGIIGFILMIIAFKVVKLRISKNDLFCNIDIYFNGKSVKLKALIDTGNMLKDPISNMPVVVAEKDSLTYLLSESILDNIVKIMGGDYNNESILDNDNLDYMSKFRVIPYTSIGRENGMLLGFRADRVIIDVDSNKLNKKNIIIGIYDKKISKNGNYNALLGLDIIEGSEDNELFESVSK